MNITFLIGNGFDVGLGMKSKFSDYFPLYAADSIHKPERIKPLARAIETDQDNWSYFEKQMGVYTAQFTSLTANDYIAQMRDFEQSFIEYLKKQEEKLSFEDKSGIAQVMTTALRDFYSESVLQAGSSRDIAKLFSDRKNESHIYNFLCFNYTSTLEKCLGTIEGGIVKKRSETVKDIIGRITHVHGAVNDIPIMGVNDASQIANQELANDSRFCKNIVKPLSNKAHRTNKDERGAVDINGSHIICVYGMSLGETDKVWWGRLLKWLKLDSKRQLVLFVHDRTFNPSTQFDWIQKEDNIIDRLASFVEEGIDVESLRPRIHLALHKNIFSIDLAQRYRDDATEILVNALLGATT